MGLTRLLRRAPIPQTVEVTTASGPVAVGVRVHPRARSYRLSVSARGEPVLTLPRGGRWSEAEAFLERNRGWLDARLARLATPWRLAPGGLVPLRGVDHAIIVTDSLRGRVMVEAGEGGPCLHVPGGPDHFRRRLLDWLKAEARADLERASARHAAALGVTIAAIRLRDQATRWGSCSSSGTLNYNWRLILAPDFVLDYVAAHEVAHRLEMNHSPAFWRTLARTLPDYGRGQAWLKAHGAKLMAL